MTLDGIERLVNYQRAYFPRDWKFTATQNEIDEIKLAYMDALADFDDDVVLQGYLKSLRSWEKMPGIAQIMTAASGVRHVEASKAALDGYRCTVCGLPWNAGHDYGREEPKRRGQIRCPNCNAVLERPLPEVDGFIPADHIEF